MRLASAADFENGGYLYSDYRRYPFFAWRAKWLVDRYGTAGKWLVAGCGWGFLVDELVTLGVDAYGVDAAAYCQAKAVLNLPAKVAPRVILADVTSRTALTAAKTAAGLTGSNKFAVTVTEDLLPMLTATETSSALTELRRISTLVTHIVSALAPTELTPDVVRSTNLGITWRTLAAWKLIVGNDLVVNTDGMTPNADSSIRAVVL